MCWPHSILFRSKVTIDTFPFLTTIISQLVTTRCGRSCIERQFNLSTTCKWNASPSSISIDYKILQQAPPEPKSGKRPQIRMLISYPGKKNIAARVVLDSWCTTPVASEKWIEQHIVQFVTRKKQKEIQNFARETVEDCSWCYTFSITCQHEDHYSKETFEIGPMEDSYDLMLPYWWMVKYEPKGFADEGKISFESEECKRTCTRHNCNSFTIKIDDTIQRFGNDPQWIEIIGNLKINDKDEMEIDWIDSIPWQYQDYKSLYNGEIWNVLPPQSIIWPYYWHPSTKGAPVGTHLRSLTKRVISTQGIHHGNA